MPSIKIKETESFDVGLRKAAAALKRNYKRVMKDSFSKLK